MADITSRDFQELIKRQKETTDKLQTIVEQNIQDDSIRERFLDNFAEIVNARSLAADREKFDIKQGMTETDDNVKETTSAVNKVGKHLKQSLVEEKNKDASEKEDKKDSIRLMSKMSKMMDSASKAIKDSFLGKAIGGTLDSIGSVIKNIVKGGLLLAALVGLEKFVNSDLFQTILDKIANFIDGVDENTPSKEEQESYFQQLKNIYSQEPDSFFGAVTGMAKIGKKVALDSASKLKQMGKDFMVAIEKEDYKTAGEIAAIFAGLGFIAFKFRKLITVPLMALGRSVASTLGMGAGMFRKGPFKMGEMGKVKFMDKLKRAPGKLLTGAKNLAGAGIKRLPGVATLGLIGAGAVQGVQEFQNITEAQRQGDEEAELEGKKELSKIGGRTAGAVLGTSLGLKAGAALGTLFGPGFGTVVGGVLGSAAGATGGFILGEKGMQKFMEEFKLFGESEKKTEVQKNLEEMKKNNDELTRITRQFEEKEKLLKESNQFNEKQKKIKIDDLKADLEKKTTEIREQQELLNKKDKMLREGKSLEVIKKNIKVNEKNNELLEQLSENFKEFKNRMDNLRNNLSNTVIGGTNNIVSNPSQQTIVMDTKIKDPFAQHHLSFT